MRKLFLIIVILFFSMPFALLRATVSQDDMPKVKATFSVDTIMIGDQPEIIVKVIKDVSQRVYFPEFQRNINDKMELISQGEIDTARNDNSRIMELTRKYKITMFDAGNYSFGGIPLILVNGEKVDTIYSDSLRITVNTFDIDLEKQSIYDIKPPVKTPLLFSEIAKYVYWGIAGWLLLALIIYIIMAYRNKKSIFTRPKLPPHVIAATELRKVKELELWQNGKYKEYYTAITDIVRDYIEDRFGRNAMEMTTLEIMASIQNDDINQRDRDMLYDLLSIADLVKFAKYVPDSSDNEDAYVKALDFVEHTKSVEVVSDNANVESVETPQEQTDSEKVDNKEEKKEGEDEK